jgi:mono/diheme cytochrome c family protein
MRKFAWGLLTGLLVVPCLGLVLALLGRVPVGATAVPPAWEAVVAQAALRRSVAREAGSLTNPLPVTEENLLTGMKYYRNACDGCHGSAAAPSEWGSTAFYPRVPQFGQAHPSLSEGEIFWVVKNGIRYTGMGAAASDMGDEDIWKIAMFLSRLGSLPPGVEARWREK